MQPGVSTRQAVQLTASVRDMAGERRRIRFVGSEDVREPSSVPVASALAGAGFRVSGTLLARARAEARDGCVHRCLQLLSTTAARAISVPWRSTNGRGQGGIGSRTDHDAVAAVGIDIDAGGAGGK